MPLYNNTSEITTPAGQRRERDLLISLTSAASLALFCITSFPISAACGFGFAVGLFAASGEKDFLKASDFIATSVVSAIASWFILLTFELIFASLCFTKTRSLLRFFPGTVHFAASPFIEICDLKNRLANIRNKNNEETERLLTPESTEQEDVSQELISPIALPERITRF